MELIDDEIIAWEDIKKQYPDEWVVIGNPIFDGMKILKGTVLAHHPDKRVVPLLVFLLRKKRSLPLCGVFHPQHRRQQAPTAKVRYFLLRNVLNINNINIFISSAGKTTPSPWLCLLTSQLASATQAFD
jgi:hypothetical protein